MDNSFFEYNFLDILNAIRKASHSNKLAHAYIINSNDEDIRNSFAILLAKILFCLSSEPHLKPCGICESCKKIDKRIYPDLYCLQPSSKSRRIPIGDDDNDENTLRWFQARFSYSSLTGNGKKVGIIFDADRMGVQAQNAFLKTLEEPPKNSYFILVTGQPAVFLPTIISRCHSLLLLVSKSPACYDFSEELFHALNSFFLSPVKDLITADCLYKKLKSMYDSLNKKAETSISTKWSKLLEESKTMNSVSRKKFEEKYDAAISGEYKLLREYFINSIYNWASSLLQYSFGVDKNLIDKSFGLDSFSNSKITKNETIKILEKVEGFCETMKLNVSEDLALRTFCLDFIPMVF